MDADAERQLLAVAWAHPAQFAIDADRLALHVSDFGDRLCGVIAGYLRHCGENTRTPSLIEAEAVLADHAVPREADALLFILFDSLRFDRTEADLADLIRAVQRQADDRAEADCRALTQDALRAVRHTFACPRCRACAGRRPYKPVSTKNRLSKVRRRRFV